MPADATRRPAKPSFVERLGNSVRDIGVLGRTLVREPKAFPKQTARTFRVWMRKVWNARGGGFYACGFVVTFIYLEASTIIGEIAAATGVVSFLTDQLVEFLFRFLGDSFGNMIQAFIWPLPIVSYSPPWGIVIFAGMYFVFAGVMKKPLEEWLFHDEE
jgi:hypothetical protein